MVTKGGHPRGSRLYKTSETIGRGVGRSHIVNLVYKNIGTWEYTRRTNILTY